MSRMPTSSLKPMLAPRPIEVLIHEFENFDPAIAAKQYPWAERFVMGLPLAPWQRDFKWSDEQCQRFIGSIWRGVHIGSYLMTEAAFRTEDAAFQGVQYLPLTNMVIDGQQRLFAIEKYITGEIASPDVNGNALFWNDVEIVDKRRFRHTIFSRGEIRNTDELYLRQYYDLLNFGGTPHEEYERALDAKGKIKSQIRLG